MPQEKTALDIINAIDATSTKELRALARIERKISRTGDKNINVPNGETSNNTSGDINISEVTVKATRRSRPKVINNDDIQERNPREEISDLYGPSSALNAKDKLTEPYRRKKRLRGSDGRFISERALNSNVPRGYASLNDSERVTKFKIASQTNAERQKDNTLKSLNDNLATLSASVEGQTKAIYRRDKNGRLRDGTGRFLSKEKLDEIKNNKNITRDSDSTRAIGGLLGAIRGLGSLGHVGGTGEGSAIDLAGTAAGGALWQMGRGAFDIAHGAVNSAVSLNDWRKEHFTRSQASNDSRGAIESTGTPLTQGNLALKPAIKYPDVEPLQQDASKSTFQRGAQHAQLKATEKQTTTLAAKDDLILKNQEDEIDLLKKILKKTANDSIGGGLFKRLFGGGNPFGRRRRGRSRSRTRTKKRGFIARTREKLSRKPKNRVGTEQGATKHKPVVQTDSTSQKTNRKAGTVSSSHEKVRNPAPDAGKSKPINSEVKRKFAANDPAIKASKTVGLGERQAADLIGGKIKPVGALAEAANDSLHLGGKIGAGALAATAVKTGGKFAAKAALKAIPILGTAAGVAWDSVDGYNDSEGQKEAFNLKDGQEATRRQKTEMSAANVAGLGGLVPLASQGLSWVADKAGFDGIAKTLDFNTADMARGIDEGITGVQNLTSSVGTAISGWFKTDDQNKSNIQNEVKSGAKSTVDAINTLSKQLQGGQFGQDGVGASGTQASDYYAPTTDTITLGENGLNIGGKNAANRNFRNNNFGNLNFAGQENAVLESQPGKGKARFARFATPEDGFRALANQISSYANGTSKAAGYQKLNTVQDIISKWAPSTENNTAKYISTVSSNLGVKSTDVLDTSKQETMVKLIRAITTYEGGNPNVSDKMIANSIGYEDGKSYKWVGGTYSKESQAHMAKNNIKPSRYANVTATGAPVVQPSSTASIEHDVNKPSATLTQNTPPAVRDASPAASGEVPNKTKADSLSVFTPDLLQAASTAGAIGAATIAHKTMTSGYTGTNKPEAQRESAGISGKEILKMAGKVGTAAIAGGGLASLSQYKDVALNKAGDMAGSALDFVKGNLPDIQLPQSILGMMDSVKNGHVMADAAKLSKQGDAKAVAALESFTGRNLSFRRPTSGLTTPVGEQAIPEALLGSVGSPDSIAKSRTPALAVNEYGIPSNDTTPQSGRKDDPQSSSVIGQIGTDEDGVPIVSNELVNRAIELDTKTGKPKAGQLESKPKKSSALSSVGDFFGGVGHTALGIASDVAPQILNSVGGLAQSFLGSQVSGLGASTSNLIGGAGSSILSAFADPLIDQGVSATTDMINNPQQVMSMFSIPTTMPAVTDLAKSGVRPDLSKPQPDSTETNKALNELISLTKQLVAGQKDKPDARPDVVVNGGQKPPKRDDRHSDSALSALMGD